MNRTEVPAPVTPDMVNMVRGVITEHDGNRTLALVGDALYAIRQTAAGPRYAFLRTVDRG